jgi:hypothetical protein
MYGSDLGDRLFPLLRHGVPLVPPTVLWPWGPLWRSPLPYPGRAGAPAAHPPPGPPDRLGG